MNNAEAELSRNNINNNNDSNNNNNNNNNNKNTPICVIIVAKIDDGIDDDFLVENVWILTF